MKKLLSLLAVGSFVASASATTVLMETFDYASDGDLDAVWNAFSDNPDYNLDTGFGNPAGSYALNSPGANFQGRQAINLGADYNPTDANPLQIKYDLYLPEDINNAWT